MNWYLNIFVFLIVVFVLAGLSIWIYQTIVAPTIANQNKTEDKKAEDKKAEDKKADNPAPVNTNTITYNSFNSTDYPTGLNLPGSIGGGTTDVNSCQTLCSNTAGCTGIVTDGKTLCALKKLNGDEMPLYNKDLTYYYNGIAPVNGAAYKKYENKEYNTANLSGGIPGSLASCQTSCNNKSDCTGFIFGKAGTDCYLKTGTINESMLTNNTNLDFYLK